MSGTKPCDHITVLECKCDERLIVSRIVWLGPLGIECLAFVHGMRLATLTTQKPQARGTAEAVAAAGRGLGRLGLLGRWITLFCRGLESIADMLRVKNFHNAEGVTDAERLIHALQLVVVVVLFSNNADHQRMIVGTRNENRSATFSPERVVISEEARVGQQWQQALAWQNSLSCHSECRRV